MNVVIAEDEALAAERLQELLISTDKDAKVVDVLDSVEELVNFFKKDIPVDLLLLDVQLADGKSFELFDKVKVDIPVIFTTAYDQYALQAFRYLSIDYLLKPVQREDLLKAISKFKRFSNNQSSLYEELILLKSMADKAYRNGKERILIKSGNKLMFKNIHESAYFFAEGKSVYLVTQKENRKHLIDYTLEELENILSRKIFFRISRKFIVNISCIQEIKGLMGARLEIKLNTPCDQEIHVSRDRVHEFKAWLDQ
jgi:DNA-binding LytR/AlgR family response regulator